MKQTQQNTINSMKKESKQRYLDLDFSNTVVGLAKEFSDFCFGLRVLDPFYDGALCRIATKPDSGISLQADVLAVKENTNLYSPQYFIDETSPIINLNQDAINAGLSESDDLETLLTTPGGQGSDSAYITYLYNQSGYKNLYFSGSYASVNKAPKIAENGSLIRTAQSNRPIAISHDRETRLFSTYTPKIQNGGFFSVAKFTEAWQAFNTTDKGIFASTNTGSLGDYFLITVEGNQGLISYNSQASNLYVSNENQILQPQSSSELYYAVAPNGNLNLCLIDCNINLNFAGGKDLMLGFTPQANLDYPMYSICEVVIFLSSVTGIPLQDVKDNIRSMYTEVAKPNNP